MILTPLCNHAFKSLVWKQLRALHCSVRHRIHPVVVQPLSLLDLPPSRTLSRSASSTGRASDKGTEDAFRSTNLNGGLWVKRGLGLNGSLLRRPQPLHCTLCRRSLQLWTPRATVSMGHGDGQNHHSVPVRVTGGLPGGAAGVAREVRCGEGGPGQLRPVAHGDGERRGLCLRVQQAREARARE